MIMEMLSPDAELILSATNTPVRTLRRVEYEALAKQGFFDHEQVELLFGMVIPMAPTDQAHVESVQALHERLMLQLGQRAKVYCQAPFAASDDSEPEPDIFVVPRGTHWAAHHSRAYLVIEVARTSLRRDRVKRVIYGRAEVDEYWIVNHAEQCVDVFRDRAEGDWRTVTRHRRGETVSPLAFPDVAIAVDDILPPAA
jgi:Uma2 family endonuclease